MKVMVLGLFLALAQGLRAMAWVGLQTPGLTPTPLIPSTVSAGQLVTAVFDINNDFNGVWPIHWSIGIHSLSDTIPSGSWDWVVDERGRYGVTKFVLDPSCPGDGMVLASPQLYVDAMTCVFAIPFYGPSPVTMAMEVRAVQNGPVYCNGNALYKVFVVNPGPTWTPSRTPTPTRTPTNPATATPTPTAGGPVQSPTRTPTAAATVWATTPVPAVSGGAVRIVMPVPNPSPLRYSFYVEGTIEKAVVTIYTYAYTKVAETVALGPLTGWNSVAVPAPGKGGFIVKVSGFVGGADTSRKFAYVYYY